MQILIRETKTVKREIGNLDFTKRMILAPKKADDELVEAMCAAFYGSDIKAEWPTTHEGIKEICRHGMHAALAVVRQDRQKARAAPLAKDGPVTPSTHGGRADGYRRAMSRTDKQNHETTTGES